MIDWFVLNFACEMSFGGVTFVLLSLFLEPLPLDRYWLAFLMPLVAAISVVYKTIKLEDITRVPKSACVLALQIVLFMASAAAFLWVIVGLTLG